MSHRGNERGMLEDQILGSPMRNQLQKDADSQFGIYCLPFNKQEQQIGLYCFVLFSVIFPICLR